MIVSIPKVKLQRNESWKRALRIEMDLMAESNIGTSYIRQCLQITQNVFTLELHYDHCIETLRQYIKRERVVNMPLLSDFVVHLQRALQFVHGNDIVHQDVTTESIFLVEKYGRPMVKLGNFKSATMVFASRKQSPLSDNNAYVTFQSDLFSLGVVMYEMITGRVTPATANGLHPAAFPLPETCPLLLQNVVELLVPDVKIPSIEKVGRLPFFYHRYCGLPFMSTKQLQFLALDLATSALTDEEAHRVDDAIDKYRRAIDTLEAVAQLIGDEYWFGLNDIIASLDKRLCLLLGS